MNELMNSEVKMTSKEVVDLINKFRDEEGNRKELEHCDFMKSIRKELESLENAGIEVGEGNISFAEYIDKQGKKRPCYLMNRSWILQMCNKESALVRYKTQQYIEALEKANSQLDKKQELQLAILNGDDTQRILALKEYENLLTKPLLDKIEEDKPKVTFADRVLKSKDNILVRQVAKIASDEGFTIGERKLYNKLREWNYICKNSTEPTQYSMDRGYFVVKLGTIDTPYGIKETRTTLVTPKGTVRIVERLLKENGIN